MMGVVVSQISLSNLEVTGYESSPPRPIHGHGISQLFHSMIEATSPEEYQFSSRALQYQLLQMAKNENIELPISCPHPEWFSLTESLMVDETICRFCGYGSDCILKQKKRDDVVSIVNLDQSSVPPQEYFEKCFLSFDGNEERKKIDPFYGFSLQAESPRNLYWISQSNFIRYAPDKSPYSKQETAVGYDVETQQSIWPLDQLFLELFLNEHAKKSIKKKLRNVSNSTSTQSSLRTSDRGPMMKIAHEVGWLLDDDDESYHEALYIIVSRFATTLDQSEIGQKKLGASSNRHFHELSLESVTPRVDHPFIHGGSGLLHLALRGLLLEPRFLHSYLKVLEPLVDDKYLEQQKEIITRISGPILEIEDSPSQIGKDMGIPEGPRRYLPRFPMIAFVPEAKVSELLLEQAAGRIIDIIVAPIAETCLLIDGLSIDLDKDGPWSSC